MYSMLFQCAGMLCYIIYAVIGFSDFQKLEIKIGTIVTVEPIEGSDKLYKLVVDLGDSERQLVAGLARDYDVADLTGRQVPILVNLEPRELFGVESRGMLLAADESGTPVLLHPGRPVSDGVAVR